MNKIEYRDYLLSPEWKEKRRLILKRAGDACERCKKNAIAAVHHLTYANVGDEPLEDLLAVCRGCHRFIHGKTKLDPILEVRPWNTRVSLEEWERIARGVDHSELREVLLRLTGYLLVRLPSAHLTIGLVHSYNAIQDQPLDQPEVSKIINYVIHKAIKKLGF